jgi:alpha-1,2-mannosyltransferase
MHFGGSRTNSKSSAKGPFTGWAYVVGMYTAQIACATIDPRRRMDDVYAKCAFGSAVMLVVVEAIYLLWSHPAFFRPTWGAMGGPVGRDFVNVWMGARSVFAGGPAGWFDAETYNAAVFAILPPAPPGDPYIFFWSYPPHLVLLTWPFGLMPYLAAYAVWCIGGLAVFAVVVRAGGIKAGTLPFVALAPAVAANVFSGQNGFLTAALLIGGLSALDRRPVLAGVLFGVLTVKPQLGLLLPIMLVLTGRWRTIAAAAATTVALVAVTAALYGPNIWIECLTKTGAQQVRLLQTMGFHLMPSAFAGMRQVGFSLDAAWVVQAAQSAAALAGTVWTFRQRRDPALSLGLLVTATFLFTPYSYYYDLTALAYVAGLLSQRDDNTTADHCLVLAAWALPLAMILVHLVQPQLPVACLVLPMLGARLLWRLRERSQATTPESLSIMCNKGSMDFQNPA